MSWSAVLTDLAGGQIADLQDLKDRKFARSFNAFDTFSFRVAAQNDYYRELHTRALEHSALIRLYEHDPVRYSHLPGQKKLWLHGPLTTTDKALGQSAQLVAIDPSWRLGFRMVGKSRQGFSRGTALVPVEQLQIVADLVNEANGEAATGVVVGTWAATGITRFVGPWHMKLVAEAIAEMSSALDGFDWDVVPVEYSAGTIGQLRLFAAMGTDRPAAAFEFGTEGLGNVNGGNHRGDPSGLLTKGWTVPAGFPSSATEPTSYSDAAAIAQRGLFEGVVPSDLQVEEFRQKLLQAHVLFRRRPRQLLSFACSSYSHPSVPHLGTDYDVGDTVRFRSWEHAQLTTDATMRVYSVDVDIDEHGVATPSPALVPA